MSLGKVVYFGIDLMLDTISYGTDRVKGVEEQLQDFWDKKLVGRPMWMRVLI